MQPWRGYGCRGHLRQAVRAGRVRAGRQQEDREQDARSLPLAVQIEETFRGYLLMYLVAAVVYKMMADVLSSEAPRSGLTVSSMLTILHDQHAIAYDGQYVTTEPTKKTNLAYKASGVRCPDVIRDPARLVVAYETSGKCNAESGQRTWTKPSS